MLSFTIQSGDTVHTRFWCDQGPHPLGYDGGSEFGGAVVTVDEMSPVWFSDMNIDVTYVGDRAQLVPMCASTSVTPSGDAVCMSYQCNLVSCPLRYGGGRELGGRGLHGGRGVSSISRGAWQRF